jgi:hypothetical protein
LIPSLPENRDELLDFLEGLFGQDADVRATVPLLEAQGIRFVPAVATEGMQRSCTNMSGWLSAMCSNPYAPPHPSYVKQREALAKAAEMPDGSLRRAGPPTPRAE